MRELADQLNKQNAKKAFIDTTFRRIHTITLMQASTRMHTHRHANEDRVIQKRRCFSSGTRTASVRAQNDNQNRIEKRACGRADMAVASEIDKNKAEGMAVLVKDSNQILGRSNVSSTEKSSIGHEYHSHMHTHADERTPSNRDLYVSMLFQK